MTEERLNKQAEQMKLKASADKPSENKRRRLIKGAVAAIPVIMTLHSGAALARTSNLVGEITDIGAAAKDGNNDLICLRPGGTDADVDSIPVDLGTDPVASVDRTKQADNITPDWVRQAEVCHSEQAGFSRGILISSVSWNSISSKPSLNLTM